MKTLPKTELIAGGLLIGMFVVSAMVWTQAPDRIPTHWNVRGEVDGYGGKFVGLLLTPLVTLGIYLMMHFLPLIDPGRANYENFRGAMRVLRLALVVFMASLYAATTSVALGVRVDMNRVVFGLLGALFVVIGCTMGKVRPNWFVGIRTPWTLSSKRSWTGTHRLGGRLFLLMGGAAWLAAIVNRPWAVVAQIVVSAAAVITMIAASYVLWRNDPDRIAPAGTTPGGASSE